MGFAQPNPASVAAVARNRDAVMAELRRLMPRMGEQRKPLPFGLAAINSHLPDGGLACGALHEIVPAAESCIAAAFGFIAAVLARISSPPPCGEGLGGGGSGFVKASTFSRHLTTPTLPSPRGSFFHRAHLWAAPLPPPRPAARSWPQRARSRSEPPDPGGNRASQGNLVGHGRGGAVGGAGRSRGHHRHARSEIEPTAASRRYRRGGAAVSAAASGDAGIERGGDALACRHGSGCARPLRPRHAAALAFATRALPQRTAG